MWNLLTRKIVEKLKEKYWKIIKKNFENYKNIEKMIEKLQKIIEINYKKNIEK